MGDDIVERRSKIEQEIGLENLFGLLYFSSGCLVICWTIPTEMVDCFYQFAKNNYVLFDSTSSLEIGDYPAINFSSESTEDGLTSEDCKELLNVRLIYGVVSHLAKKI